MTRQRQLILIGGLIIVGIGLWFLAMTENYSPREPVSEITEVRPYFTLDEIMGADSTLREALKLRSQTIRPDPIWAVKQMIVPHHAFVAGTISEAWARLAAGSRPSVIVLVGPNHWNLDQAKIQTTNGIWQTTIGQVETDEILVDKLVRAGAAKTTAVFGRDHSIGVHLPYVAALFPEAKLVPIAFSSHATATDARAVLEALLPVLPADAVLVYSLDFSHYLSAEEARVKDIETFAWMTRYIRSSASVQSEAELQAVIDAAGPDHFDSHAAVNMFGAASARLNCNPHVTWYGNSGDIAHDSVGETTSYFIWMCDEVSENNLVIQAGGDVMLDRGIELIRRDRGAANFMHDIAVALAGADIRFANLESVISNRGQNSQKEISFRADIDALESILAAGLNVISVANNHALDWGRAAWEDSKERLLTSGILPIGGFSNFETEPMVTTVKGKQVAFLGFNTTDRVLTDEMLADKIKKAAELAPTVIVSFHWGVEYEHQPTNEMQRLARLSIDNGADLVLGHHPHVLQGFEVYQGKLIAYSLGNLVFDQRREGTHQSVVTRIVINEEGRGNLELMPLDIDNEWVTRYAAPESRAQTITDLASWSFSDLQEDLKDGRASW